jgi:hypothetical protein
VIDVYDDVEQQNQDDPRRVGEPVDKGVLKPQELLDALNIQQQARTVSTSDSTIRVEQAIWTQNIQGVAQAAQSTSHGATVSQKAAKSLAEDVHAPARTGRTLQTEKWETARNLFARKRHESICKPITKDTGSRTGTSRPIDGRSDALKGRLVKSLYAIPTRAPT